LRKMALAFTLCSLFTLLAPPAVPSATAQTPEPATDNLLASSPAIASETDAFLSSLQGVPAPLPAGPGRACAFGCTTNSDCFLQGWTPICQPAVTGTAPWCFGYPNVTNCEGECGCL
jgi:hypothetical protein